MNEKTKKRTKYIWKFAKPYKWSFVNAFLCILLTSIISMTYPYVFGLLVDEVFYNKNMRFFIFIIIGYAIIYLTEQLLHLILNILWPYQFTVYLLDIRKAIDRKIVSLKYEKLTNMPVGDMIGKINWQADSFVELIHRNLSYLFSNTFKLIAIVGIVFLMNYKLALLLVIVVPISYVVSFKLGKKVGRKQKAVQDSYMSFMGWIFEMLSGMRDIRLFGAEKKVSEKCYDQIKDMNSKGIEVAKIDLVSDRVCALIALATNVSLYVIAALLIYHDNISLGRFIAVISYFELANTLLASINKVWGKIHSNIVIIDEIVKLFESESEEKADKVLPSININAGRIEFDDVSFAYDEDNKVLEHLDFVVNAGERVALVGRSGAGKSTIANLLLRLLNANEGRVKIDNQDIDCHSIKSIRNQIGIVQQEIFVFDGTIRSNLLLANPNANDDECTEALKNAYLEDYINGLKDGLDMVIGQGGISMSGGERQRLAIARLFLRNPRILIFDEATSALDFETETYVNKAWEKLSLGKTSIIIAHRLSTVLSADKVAVLENGVIVGYDTHDVLLNNNDQYKKLFEEQYLTKEKVLNH